MRVASLSMVFVGAILILSAVGTAARAETVIFQNGFSNLYVADYAGHADNMLINNYKSAKNYGGYELVIVGDATWGDTDASRGLMRFDLSAMAGDYSAINSVTLRLKKRDANPREVNVFAILAANNGWVAGTAPGVAQTGSSCWNYAVDSSTTWQGSAGCGTAGIDYDATALSTVNMPTVANQFVDFAFTGWSTAELKTLIDYWAGPQESNAGILLKATEEGGDVYGSAFVSNEFNAGDGYTAADRPQLIIDYSPVPEPSTCTMLMTAVMGIIVVGRRRR